MVLLCAVAWPIGGRAQNATSNAKYRGVTAANAPCERRMMPSPSGGNYILSEKNTQQYIKRTHLQALAVTYFNGIGMGKV